MTTITRDIRLDRLVSWTLATMVMLLVGMAGVTYNDLRVRMMDLSSAVSSLNASVISLQSNNKTIERLEKDVSQLLLWQARRTGEQNGGGR